MSGRDAGPGSNNRWPEPHPAPKSAIYCNDLVGLGGEGGVVAGFDWSGEKHEFTETVTFYVCMSPGFTGITVDIRPLLAGISTDQDEQFLPESELETPTGSGVFPFRIRVSPGAGGFQRSHVREIDLKRPYTIADMAMPRIVTDADGWRFARREEDRSDGRW